MLQRIEQSIELLDSLVSDPTTLASLPESVRTALLRAAGKLSRPDRGEKKVRNRQIKQALKEQLTQRQREVRAATGIRQARQKSVFISPPRISDTSAQPDLSQRVLDSPRNCYVCKKEFTTVHYFYDALCPECAEFNYQKRFQSAPLDGTVAIITGSRLKIGYQSTLMMLRAGATVIATTRFPVDSSLRFSQEDDFSRWKDRLHIYGLDLRHIPSVEMFCTFVAQRYSRLDILVNNAAQTVRRPAGFYAHLMALEERPFWDLPPAAAALLTDFSECTARLGALSDHTVAGERGLPVAWNAALPGIGLRASAQLSQIPYSYDQGVCAPEVFPTGALDADLQQVDLRTTNSWRLCLGEIPTAEMIELQLVNSIAPFVLCNRLVPLMKRDNTGQKHIVNVSAMEGKFMRFEKGARHPHTNMAKAALNMLTHTSASALSGYGIYMNAVDTGWVTDEDPAVLARRKQEEHDFQPPLDIVDGAARVCDPFFHGILTGTHWCGKFLKDYFPIDW